MSSELISVFEQEYRDAKANHPEFGPGDTINVHLRIKEGDKEREHHGMYRNNTTLKHCCICPCLHIASPPFQRTATKQLD